MFGALRISKGRLDEEQRQRYRAAFCAGCHALHAVCGRPASLLVNYDQTVMAMVLAGLGPERPIEARACTAFPLRTIGVAPLDDRAAALLAALDVGAVEAKLRDDIADGDRPLLGRVALRCFGRARGRARDALRTLGFPLSMLDELPTRQAEVERRTTPTIEILAGPSAELTGQMFAHAGLAVEREDLVPELHAFGTALGIWVYAFDAWNDLADDARLGRFNAWLAVDITSPQRIRAILDEALDRALATRQDLPLAAHGELVDALLASLRERTARVAPATSGLLPRDRRQAGDCDCGIIDCGCCASGCGESACGGAAGGASMDAASCGGCDVCCDSLCCWWSLPGPQRRALRQTRRAARSGADLSRIDLSPLVGARGIASTDLIPDGRISVHRLEFDAVADTGMIDAGAPVVVVAVERGRLRVERVRP